MSCPQLPALSSVFIVLSAIRACFTHSNQVLWLLHLLKPSLLSRYGSALSSSISAGREAGRNNFSTIISN